MPPVRAIPTTCPPRAALLALGAAAALALGAAPAGAQTGPPEVGYDISYPQCGKPFPVAPAFTIVGVNGGRPFTANPCLSAELAWAGPGTAFYVNTSSPGPARSTRWPTGQAAPLPCATPASPGADTTNCAYDYGWNAGLDAYATAVAAYRSLGLAPPGATTTPTANVWWLDVESANSWRSDPLLNVAALQGQVAALSASGAAGVGLYSVAGDWKAITGNTTAFAVLPSWVAGPGSQTAALAVCGGPGFTGGGVALVQFPSAGFDGNVRCPAAIVGAAAGPAGHRLRRRGARGDGRPAVDAGDRGDQRRAEHAGDRDAHLQLARRAVLRLPARPLDADAERDHPAGRHGGDRHLPRHARGVGQPGRVGSRGDQRGRGGRRRPRPARGAAHRPGRGAAAPRRRPGLRRPWPRRLRQRGAHGRALEPGAGAGAPAVVGEPRHPPDRDAGRRVGAHGPRPRPAGPDPA